MNPRKRLWRAFAPRLLAMALAAIPLTPFYGQHLTILHSNDLHGQIFGLRSGSLRKGGFEALSAVIRRERDHGTLVLDAGDFQIGTLISRLPVDGVRGGGMVRLMNLVGIDACAIGNHEFDYGWENLKRMEAMARFELLAANLTMGDSLFIKNEHAVHPVNGVRTAVIGLASGALYKLVFPGRLGGIRIEDPAAAARRLVRQLDPVTDLIVLLTHQGFREDSLLASAVPQADVIIGGHSHSVLKRPVRVNGVLVCQAGSNSEWLGRLDLDVRDDRIASYSARLVPVQCRAGEADPEVARLVDDYRLRIEAQYGRVIGKIKTAWTPARDRESNIGDFFADVIRERAGTDFAVINSGGIRKGLGRGPVREMDILEIFPFENRLVRFSCTGREVLKLVGTNARSAYERSRGILQVSGLRYTAHRDRMGNVAVREAWINREPVRTDRVYTAAAVDYLVPYNAREFFGFEPGSEEDLGVFLADAAIEYIRSHPVIQSRVEGRMRHER